MPVTCIITQVIPTVGVGGEGAEGEKKLTAQLKHFRNLVDEQASKVPHTPDPRIPYPSTVQQGQNSTHAKPSAALYQI